MSSSKEYVDFILDQCSGLSARPMMGEYILYYHGKVVAGVFGNRLLAKPTPSAVALLPDATWEYPYDGAKARPLVENVEDGEFLKMLFEAMYEELPEPRQDWH